MKVVRSILTSLSAAGILLLQLGCGGDASGPGHVATSIAANSSTTLTAPPGTAVTELPSVLVRDEAGSPLGGAPVTFVVTGGGGSVTGSTLTTGPSGTATVGGWTLGTAAGPNTLEARSGNLPAVTFTAKAAGELKARLAATSTLRPTGRVVAVTGLALRFSLPGVRVGDVVHARVTEVLPHSLRAALQAAPEEAVCSSR